MFFGSFLPISEDSGKYDDALKLSRCGDIEIDGLFDKSPPKHSQITATFAAQNKLVKETCKSDAVSFPFKKPEGYVGREKEIKIGNNEVVS